jgi:hypothetical protein
MRFELTLSLAALPGVPFADEVERGREMAGTRRATCRVIAPDQAAGADAAPAFATIAGDPPRTDHGLVAWLSDPRPIMPNLDPPRDELQAAIAYIRSLER